MVGVGKGDRWERGGGGNSYGGKEGGEGMVVVGRGEEGMVVVGKGVGMKLIV